jgi:predicted nucleic-acid-binding protein
MIALDTNVIVRYVAQDDAVQSPIATRFIESFSPESPGFISIVTLVETIWVLRSFYDASRQHIQKAVEALLRTRGLRIERSELVWTALRGYSQGTADFADYLMERFGDDAGCDYTVTFDKGAVASSGMKLLR